MMKEGELSLNHLCTLSGVREYSVDYYPQGWSLIYYLLYAESGKYRPAFNGFFQMMTKGRFEGDGVGMFKKGFGRNPDDFKPEWQKYFETLEPKTPAEFTAAATAAYTRWLDFESAQSFAESALKGVKAKDEKVLLCNARLHLTLGRWETEPKRKAEEYGKAIDFFEQVFPPPAKDAKPAVVPKAKLTPQYASDRLDYAKACIGGGRYEQAQDVIDDLLGRKEYEFNAEAYSAYALLAATAEDPAFRDLEAAKENAAIAEDLGADQDNKYVLALIAIAEDRKDKAAKYLSEAAARDQFGFGGRFYSRELARLVRPVRVVEPGAGDGGGEGEPKPKPKPKAKD
jgi:tetratricopeptide (TPR) repeat protein